MARQFTTTCCFAPTLESLDGRFVPSCTWAEAGGVLTITGDAAANVVEIADDGTTLTVTCDGESVELGGDVTEIVIDLKSGNDTVTFTRTATAAAPPAGGTIIDTSEGNPVPAEPAPGTARSLSVDLGNGNDTFTGSAQGSLGEEADFGLVVLGNNGQDELSFAADGLDVADGASVSVELRGGNGKDQIELAFAGVVLGELSLLAAGENANDVVSAEVELAAGSTGEVDAEALGGNGNDEITLLATDDSGADSEGGAAGESTLGGWHVVADGGTGPDAVEASDAVEVAEGKRKKR